MQCCNIMLVVCVCVCACERAASIFESWSMTNVHVYITCTCCWLAYLSSYIFWWLLQKWGVIATVQWGHPANHSNTPHDIGGEADWGKKKNDLQKTKKKSNWQQRTVYCQTAGERIFFILALVLLQKDPSFMTRSAFSAKWKNKFLLTFVCVCFVCVCFVLFTFLNNTVQKKGKIGYLLKHPACLAF